MILFVFLILVDLVSTGLGIYLLDYQVDGIINQPWMILLSIAIGFGVTLLVIVGYIDGLYLLIAKRRPRTSMLMHKVANQMMAIPLIATNTRIKVSGLEKLPKNTGFPIYSNHTSMMDIPVLMTKLNNYPVAFLAKEVVGKLFSFGKWTPQLGCVMIDRSSDRKSVESILQVIQYVKTGSTMVIFPEGTRSKEIGTLREFKPGSFKVALKSKTPLVPITIVKPTNFKQVKWPFPKRIHIIIHDPLPYDGYRHMSSMELAKHVETIIASGFLAKTT